VKPPARLDGRDLTPLLGHPDAPAVSDVVAETGGVADRFTKTLVDGTWKVHVHHRSGTDLVELYDLAADPWETANVAEARTEIVARLLAKLWGVCDGESRLTAARPSAAGTLTQAERERLESLGYTH
jgi:arylsulfatase A-like enzyme